MLSDCQNTLSVSSGSRAQPASDERFLDLLIHSGGTKPSTKCDRLSAALVSNVQC